MRAGFGRRGTEEGAAAVEFALVMPLLVLFIFGIMQFGLYFYRWQGLQAIAHEGARGASVGLSVLEIKDRIERSLNIPADFADVTIDVVLIDESTNTELLRINGKTTDPGEQGTSMCEGLADPRDFTVRVEVGLNPATDKYDVIIPLWGSLQTDYGSVGVFGCEAVS